jgi:hypothetical protein
MKRVDINPKKSGQSISIFDAADQPIGAIITFSYIYSKKF